MQGLIYATGNLTIGGAPTINGAVVAGGTLTMNAAPLNLTYNSVYSTSPPVGFYGTPRLKPAAGTWKVVTN